jgi:hypothetical protein
MREEGYLYWGRWSLSSTMWKVRMLGKNGPLLPSIIVHDGIMEQNDILVADFSRGNKKTLLTMCSTSLTLRDRSEAILVVGVDRTNRMRTAFQTERETPRIALNEDK